MRRDAIALIAASFSAAGLLGTTMRSPRDPSRPANKGAVVVELFTSEGCSSCPAADRVLSQLRSRARTDGAPIYAIAFHVDYWNHLGWKDRFSSAEFSTRQRNYSQAMGLPSVYTPQMIVNGAAEFIGSDRDRADREIERALVAPQSIAVTASLAERKAGEPFVVRVTTRGAPEGATLCAALVEDGLSNQVNAGENQGRHLEHDGVVRAFAAATIGGATPTSLTLKPPADVREENASLVILVQDAKTLHTLGATALPAGPVPTQPKSK